jgi:sugar phosphate isomerase/epimerase
MKLGVCSQIFYHLPLTEGLAFARELGIEAVEIPVHRGNPFIDLDAALDGAWEDLARVVDDAGMTISALSIHQEGQLLLGPHGEDTDGVMKGTPEEKSAYAQSRMIKAGALAQKMGLDVVVGFTGCEDYSRWFPWPLADGYSRMAGPFREKLMPVLDAYGAGGVRFAHECHPRQFAYNLETALWAVEIVDDHPAMGFNLDPANLLLAGMDPVVFVAELGHRIHHVHAKDGQSVPHRVGRSGLLAHGAWDRKDRGFRFRVPGWGDLHWKALITELQLAGFRGTLSIEHEDPTMSRREGLQKAVAHLRPLLLRDPPEARWW